MKTKLVLNALIAMVWIVNGLFCKVLNLVPRHQNIVSEITHTQFSRELTLGIGVLEIYMALWILSNIKPKLNALVQIIIIALMNILEYILVPNLLLWGKCNSIFAFILIAAIYLNNFNHNKPPKTKAHALHT